MERYPKCFVAVRECAGVTRRQAFCVCCGEGMLWTFMYGVRSFDSHDGDGDSGGFGERGSTDGSLLRTLVG